MESALHPLRFAWSDIHVNLRSGVMHGDDQWLLRQSGHLSFLIASNPQNATWSNIFDVGAGFQASFFKDQPLGARGSRALTP